MTTTETRRDAVLRMLTDGVNIKEIANAAACPRTHIIKLARENGWRINGDGRAYRPTSKPQPTADTANKQGGVDELLARAQDIDDPRIRSAVRRVNTAAAELRTRVDEHTRLEAERRYQQQRHEAAITTVERFEQQLADARRHARAIKATSTGGAAERGLHPTEVRAWALEHGVTCPQFGRVPTDVLDAYEAAHRDHPETSR